MKAPALYQKHFIDKHDERSDLFRLLQDSLQTKELDSCFTTKSGKAINKDTVEKTMRGPAYKYPAYAYIFMKT